MLAMGLLRSIVGGFGFTIGARAADELLDSADKSLEERERERAKPPTTPTIKVEDQLRAMAKEAEARKKSQAKREKEVEKELSALKKRLAVEAKLDAKKR